MRTLMKGPTMKNAFFRGHGLGNDYLAMNPADLDIPLSPRNIRAICDRHRGVGSDGILALTPSKKADFGLRIFNPDGSEAEKSGNGLRIFGCYLYHTGRTRRRSFSVETKGGLVGMTLHVNKDGEVDSATVEMGLASFHPNALPCTLRVNELVRQSLTVAGRKLTFTGFSVGNPHCVIFRARGQAWSREELLTLGPALENHPAFPKRVNVQLAVPT